MIQAAIQSTLFTGAMGMSMTFMFGVHQVLVMQGVLLPVNSTDNILVKKYIFGQTTNDEGGAIHGNVDEEPPVKEAVTDVEPTTSTDTVEILEETVNKDTNPTKESKKASTSTGLKKRAGKGDKDKKMDEIDE